MDNRLTVIVPCKDERHNLVACVESFREIADEILIADSGSTDGTLEIVRQLGGCRLVQREYVHSGNFKNWAIPQAAHPWVLIVDADERVTSELAHEIKRTLAEGPACDGYWIYRNNHFLGHRVRHGDWGRDKVLRLFRRDLSRYVGDTDHAEVEVSTGNVGRLNGRLTHYTFSSYDQYFRKVHRYATHQARQWHQAGKRPRFFKMLLTAPFRFFHTYIVRGGVLDGWVGLQVCMMIAFYSFFKQARLWELYNRGMRQQGNRREHHGSAHL